MESILRATAVYLFLLAVFRISGKRTLAETSSFDLVLLLIISETTQQAMVGEDHSLINAVLLILTLVGADILISFVRRLSPAVDAVLEGTPVVIVRNGKAMEERLARERIDLGDILEAARSQRGIERLSQIKLAILERDGQISIIPKASVGAELAEPQAGAAVR